METDIESMLIALQYRLLKWLSPTGPNRAPIYATQSKIEAHHEGSILQEVQGKVVLDFGCGEGEEAVKLAQAGAKKVIGIDIRPDIVGRAREKAARAGVSHLCCFSTQTDENVDVVTSFDGFEHFREPEAVLAEMYRLLKPSGFVLLSFGPTWYHPHGGHLFSVFPWAHLLFSEKALIRWRADIRSDGATCFEEVEGGLNRMTIRRFERLVRNSPFLVAYLDFVPIRRLRPFHNQLTREFTTSIVRCRLAKRLVQVV